MILSKETLKKSYSKGLIRAQIKELVNNDVISEYDDLINSLKSFLKGFDDVGERVEFFKLIRSKFLN